MRLIALIYNYIQKQTTILLHFLWFHISDTQGQTIEK